MQMKLRLRKNSSSHNNHMHANSERDAIDAMVQAAAKIILQQKRETQQ